MAYEERTKASLLGLAFVVGYLIGFLQGADSLGHLANHDFQKFNFLLQFVNAGTGNEFFLNVLDAFG